MVETGHRYKDNVSKLISWGHWFSFFNIMLALAIATRYLAIVEWPDSLLGKGYLLVSWLGHFGFLVFAFYLLILFPLTFLVPFQRSMRFIGVIVATTGLTLLLLDTQVFEQLRQHLGRNQLVWEYLSSGDTQFLFVVVPALFLLELVISGLVWKKLRNLSQKHIGMTIGLVFFVAFFFTHTINIWADAVRYHPITQQKANFPLSYPMTAKSFLLKHGWVAQDDMKGRAIKQPSHQSGLKYPLRPLEFSDTEKPLNLMLIVVDALRADMLNPDVMPALYQFSQHSSVFQQHFSGSNNTKLGIYSLFYGLPSNYWDTISMNYISPVLMDTLQQKQYQLGLFSSVGFVQPEFMQTAFTNVDELDLTVGKSKNAAQGDIIATNNWQKWITSQGDSPKFSFLYYTGPSNMDIAPGASEKFRPTMEELVAQSGNQGKTSKRQAMFNNYKNAVYHTDELLKQVFDTLVEHKQLENTVVVVTAAHGLEFNDTGHNNWGHNSNYSWSQTQVPMVIYWPGKEPGAINKDTSHLDLAPTLMKELLQSKTSTNSFSSGLNLFGSLERDYILMGNSGDYVIYQKDKITEFPKAGGRQVLNRQYQPLQNTKTDMQVLLQVWNDIERFYKTEN